MKTLEEMTELARELVDAEQQVEALETQLKQKKEDARLLRELVIPAAMTELGLRSMELSDGQTLTIKDDLSCSLPKDVLQRERAMTWLIDHQAGGLIKSEVTVAFDREKIDEATKLVEDLQSLGLVPEMETSVHPATLKAYIKETLAANQPVDFGLFNVHCYQTTKLKGA